MAKHASPSLKIRYEAAMVLSGVGDALGYKNGSWEFCHSGEEIHKQLKTLGGVNKIKVNAKNWMVSDDTVMHIATAEALADWFDFTTLRKESPAPCEKLYLKLATKYKECMGHMTGRAPGATCINSCHLLNPGKSGGYLIPFDPRGGGCGAAMRAMCIGLSYPRPDQIHDLITVSIESGRMTHHHPTGYLGALAAALFTSFAVQGKPVKEWGHGLMETLPKALNYVKSSNHYVKENVNAWDYFKSRWREYLALRNISDGKSDPIFPENYGIKERDAFYKLCSYSGWGGSSGHDAPMIAYDALLSYDGTWPDLCSRSMFHSGDSDSTGVIAACCYGAMFGYVGVHENNYKHLEFRDRLKNLSEKLFSISHLNSQKPEQEKLTSHSDGQEQRLEYMAGNSDCQEPERKKRTCHAEGQEPEHEKIASHPEGQKPEHEKLTSYSEGQKSKPQKKASHSQGQKLEPQKRTSQSVGQALGPKKLTSHSKDHETKPKMSTTQSECQEPEHKQMTSHANGQEEEHQHLARQPQSLEPEDIKYKRNLDSF